MQMLSMDTIIQAGERPFNARVRNFRILPFGPLESSRRQIVRVSLPNGVSHFMYRHAEKRSADDVILWVAKIEVVHGYPSWTAKAGRAAWTAGNRRICSAKIPNNQPDSEVLRFVEIDSEQLAIDLKYFAKPIFLRWAHLG